MLSCADANVRNNCRNLVQVETSEGWHWLWERQVSGRLHSEGTTTCQPVESLPLHPRLHSSQRRCARTRTAQRAAADGRPPSVGAARSGHRSFVRQSSQPNPSPDRPPCWSFCSRSCTWMAASKRYSAAGRESCRNADTRRPLPSLLCYVTVGCPRISPVSSSDLVCAAHSKFDLRRRTDKYCSGFGAL